MTTDYEKIGRAMLAAVEAGTDYPDQGIYGVKIDASDWLFVERPKAQWARDAGFIVVVLQRESPTPPVTLLANVYLSVGFLRDQPATSVRGAVEQLREALDAPLKVGS